MKIHKSQPLFQHHGDDVFLFTLTNNKGIEVCISNFGAIIQSFKVPNRGGEPIDIVLGFDQMEQYSKPDYQKTMTYLGAIIGRYANRVANAQFEIDGQTFPLSPNLPPHQLHGGFDGFDSKVWKVIDLDDLNNKSLKMTYLSKDLEEGYPGNLFVSINFSLTENNELVISTEASSDKPTAINLTHHDYFNLNGLGRVDKHLVQISAANYLGQQSDYVPSGEILPVKGTEYDFNSLKAINYNWDPNSGYDQSFLLDKDYGSFGKSATAYSEQSGIKLDVFTDEPTIHFYTGNHLGIKSGKNDQDYGPFTAFCFETQHHCDALHNPNFPSTILRPGEVYKRETRYCVSCD